MLTPNHDKGNTLNINIPKDQARTIQRVLAIAQKAHENNPSPVDIKLQLAEVPLKDLNKLHSEFNNVLS